MTHCCGCRCGCCCCRTKTHFSDLREHAVRGLLRPGLEVVLVSGGSARRYTVVGDTVLRYGVGDDSIAHARVNLKGSHVEHFHFASDMGLWHVPGVSYQNPTNYVLDVEALRAKGIEITGVKEG